MAPLLPQLESLRRVFGSIASLSPSTGSLGGLQPARLLAPYPIQPPKTAPTAVERGVAAPLDEGSVSISPTLRQTCTPTV